MIGTQCQNSFKSEGSIIHEDPVLKLFKILPQILDKGDRFEPCLLSPYLLNSQIQAFFSQKLEP